MKKLILKSFLTVALGLTLFIVGFSFYSQKVSADSATISYITTCVGENETSIGINYHCSIENSFVQYSTTSTFTQETTKPQAATSTLWGAEVDPNDKQTGFNERYVCKVNLTDLQENTQYYYRVCAGTSVSSVYKFKTTSASATSVKFLFATDIHAAGGAYTPTRPNTMMNNVRANIRNINLLVLTGDQVDRGGYEAHWKSYYSGMQIYNDITVASIPGNHEYYHTSGPEYVSPLYYNQFHNNPKNGPETKINSSYYFNYGNVLFIMLDVIDKKSPSEHKEWLKQTIESNPSQWIIVGTHANAITGGSYSSDSKWMMSNFGDIFEQYQVDLVIGGHEHIYLRKDNLYDKERNDDLGVTYYVSPAAQHKQYGMKEDYMDTVDEYDNINYKINAVTVTDQKLSLSVFDESGEEFNNSRTGKSLTFELMPKRSKAVTTQKDSTLLKGLKLNHDKENEDATISWSRVYYGNVKNVKVECQYGDNIVEHSQYIASEKQLSLNIGPIYNDRNYKVKVSLIKYDGSIIEQEYDIINLIPYNLNLELDGGILTTPEEWVTYLSGKVTKLPKPIKDGHVFKGWFENELFEGDAVEKITKDETGDKTYYAKWARQYSITYELQGGNISTSAPKSYIEGDSFSLLTPYRDSDMFLGWYDNPEFTGEPIENITETTKGDLVLYANWAKKNSISYDTCGGELTPNAKDSYYDGDSFKLPTPTRESHKFLGWFNSQDYTGESISAVTIDTRGDLVLYAKWAERFTITYNSNGGNINQSAENEYYEGDSLSLQQPTHSTDKFLGWYSNPEFTGEPISEISENTKGNINLYAKWAKKFNITYDSRGGSLDQNVQTSYFEGDAFTLQTPTKNADTFLGWYDNPEFTGEAITNISEDTKGDIKLYAKWNSDVDTKDDNNNETPIPEPTKKKCGKKNTTLIINLLASVSLFFIVFKKRK